VRAPLGQADGTKVSYLSVLRAPAMGTLCTLMFVSAFVGYAQLNSGMPAYARAIGEVSTRGLGLAFAANTLVIVLLQLLVLQRIEGRRRTRVIVLMAVVWAGSWALLGATGAFPGTWAATFFVAACASVFALGETLLQPTMPAIVNDLAPEHLRGRYNGLSTLAWTTGFLLGPAIAGVALDAGVGSTLFSGLVAAGLVAALGARRLAGHLSPAANLVEGPPRERRRRRTAIGARSSAGGLDAVT
jgi:MFS family permease